MGYNALEKGLPHSKPTTNIATSIQFYLPILLKKFYLPRIMHKLGLN
jgi:hypothetical protein